MKLNPSSERDKVAHRSESLPRVAILMGTYNGERYLVEQLDSIVNQTYKNWRLIVSDDGSSDGTLEILEGYQRLYGSEIIEIRSGSKNGFVQNFLSIACDPCVEAEYFAFSDQDDIWLPEKLEVALDALQVTHIDIPALYCGRTKYIDSKGRLLGESGKFVHPKIFRNALVQSIAGGNTMVFTKGLKKMLESTGVLSAASHDWWLYLLVTGAGGRVIFDQNPQVEYRQHPDSLVGENRSMGAKIERVRAVITGKFRESINRNLECIQNVNHLLTPENSQILDLFMRMRNSEFKDRFRLMEVCGLYRQSWQGTLTLVLAAALKRI